MVKEDLMSHAESDVDFYALLGVAFETSESDIRRAYRKTALKYHPDKLGRDFDPEKFHLLQIANDVLSDPAAKSKYDNARNAKLQRQRQNELFEGKRRQMKEDLEAREQGGASSKSSAAGMKRSRPEDETEKMLRELAEKGKRRREQQERDKLRAHRSSPSVIPEAAPSPVPFPAPEEQHQTAAEEAEEEDEVAALERRISEMKADKARKKAEKKARKSGVFVPVDSPAASGANKRADASGTPIKYPDIFNGLKADEKPSASPKFSFSPSTPGSSSTDFAATMKRLKEQQKLADGIRVQEAEATQ